MGPDDDLRPAHKALRNLINFLAAAKGMNYNDAYMLISGDGDVEMTELVDRNMAVHVVIPKAPFTMR